MKRTKVLFLRGLNTYGDEWQRLGWLKFGKISKPLVEEFARLDWEVVPVLNIGTGTLEQQCENAFRSLLQTPEWRSGEQFHLLAHSMGGLIGRALVHRPEVSARVKSLTTIATPHHGADIANTANGLHQTHPHLHRLGAIFSYDTMARSDCFESLTPEALKRFNQEFPNLENANYASVTCALPEQCHSWPYKALRMIFPNHLARTEGDGMISLETQFWGQHIGTYALDHLMEVGYCLDLRPRIRRHFRKEFRRMVSGIHEFLQKLERPA